MRPAHIAKGARPNSHIAQKAMIAVERSEMPRNEKFLLVMMIPKLRNMARKTSNARKVWN